MVRLDLKFHSVAEIWLTPKEDGLNLNMDADTIKQLVKRGRQAGREIAERFADLNPTDAMSWEGHRWARFRSGIAGLMETVLAFKHANAVAPPGELSARGVARGPRRAADIRVSQSVAACGGRGHHREVTSVHSGGRAGGWTCLC